MIPLSPRQIEVLKLCAEGFKDEVIAMKLLIAVTTLKTHLNDIRTKLGIPLERRGIEARINPTRIQQYEMNSRVLLARHYWIHYEKAI